MPSLNNDARDLMFLEARTLRQWQSKPVATETLHELWSLARMGPTANNLNPARIVFVTTDAGREKLKPCLAEGNIEKTMTAPVTAIIGYDMAFYEKAVKLNPDLDLEKWRGMKPDSIQDNAFRNGTLQGAYLMLAARAVGLDCGPMSGFNKQKTDETFFAGTSINSNWLCNMGYGDRSTLKPREPRYDFDDVCEIV